MKKYINIMSIATAIFALISSCIGLFYTSNGARFVVQNIYGQDIELYGDGIYAYNSILKAGAAKGTDLAMLIIVIMLFITVILKEKYRYMKFSQVGFLSAILYNSVCLAFGVTFNRLFPLYLLLFSFSLFTFIFELLDIIKEDNFDVDIYEKKLIGTAIFMFVSGCSVLVWLMFIIPAVLTGNPMEIIEIYTTEPTFIIDIGIILPTAVVCGILLLKKKVIGYKLAPVLLTLISCVGLCVIGQTIMQTFMGIVLPIGQIIGLVGSFVVLGTIAIGLNIRILKFAK